MNTLPQDTKTKARHLYWQGFTVKEIGELLATPESTLYAWRKEYSWDDAKPVERMESALEARYLQLVIKEGKSNLDFKEIDALGKQIERFAKIGKYSETGKPSDLNPAFKERAAKGAKAKNDNFIKNEVGDENLELLQSDFHDSLFEYQANWWQASKQQRIRNILKSRQIGATWYFAREAFLDALETGKNKVFLSASKAQAFIFRNYIVQWVFQTCGVTLTGDPIVLPNGATLYFLGTNAKTAQGYHGDVYMDEYFWIHGFEQFRKVTSGMAMHKQWKQTYFSTPSALTHEAYPFWSGDAFNSRVKQEQRVKIDLSHEALSRGRLCEDRQWRQIVTIEDAMRGGCDLFDIDALRLEYSEDEFNNLLMCEFMDDSQSIFPLSKMQSCLVDSWLVWRDLKPFAPKPIGDKEVWLGYDPNGNNEGGDGAGLVAIAAGKGAKEVHRIIEKSRFWGADYETQANTVMDWCKRYRVTYIGIDTTGIGGAVAEILQKKGYPVKSIHYSPDTKFRLVTKALNVIDRGRLQMDAGEKDIVQAFMAVRRELSASQRHVTYVSGRNAQTGHAELAWATMNALYNEAAEADSTGLGSSMMEMYG